MSDAKEDPAADIKALASEVMDLWQDHLATYAADTSARGELMRLIEPQRQLFADWAAMMQNTVHGVGHATGTPSSNGSHAGEKSGRGASTARTAPAAASSDDSTLRLAQLAHRTGELEKRLKSFELRLEKLESAAGKAPAKTGRDPKSRKSRIH